jgi:hypothetical protein
MATLQIHNFPDPLYDEIKRRAESNHRGILDEIVWAIEASRAPHADRLDAKEKLRAAARLRAESSGAWITDDWIHAARHEGRE